MVRFILYSPKIITVIKLKIGIITLVFMILLSFFMINKIVEAANADFDAWTGAPRLFTIGKTELVNIYVRNKYSSDDRFNITNYTKYASKQGLDVSHLVSVSIQSNEIRTLIENETGDTFAKITILAPIDSGSVSFNITSFNDPTVYHEISINLETGSPIILSEFDLSGLIQILFLTVFILIVSYASHFG